MSSCTGFKEECVSDDASNSTTIQSSVTACSDLSLFFRFRPEQALLGAVDNPDSAPKTGWPSYLTDDFTTLAPTSQAMALFYVFGTCAVGLSILFRLGTVRYIWQTREPPEDSYTAGPPGYSGDPRSQSPPDSPPSTFKVIVFVVSFVLSLLSRVYH